MKSTTKIPLTGRQLQVYNLIMRFRRKHGYSPTLREIAALRGNSYINGVVGHVKALKRKGWILWEEGEVRTVRPVAWKVLA